uniref:Uncharacterized protein n=1 Tax=Glossina brevipalpis TaxID=37001 RepID=A0A1A9W0G8_9MUSC
MRGNAFRNGLEENSPFIFFENAKRLRLIIANTYAKLILISITCLFRSLLLLTYLIIYNLRYLKLDLKCDGEIDDHDCCAKFEEDDDDLSGHWYLCASGRGGYARRWCGWVKFIMSINTSYIYRFRQLNVIGGVVQSCYHI